MHIVHGLCYAWSEIKDAKLRRERGIGFMDVMRALETDELIYFGVHHSLVRRNQFLIVVSIENYPFVVPAVPTPEGFFLKTIFPSRRFKDGQKN